MAIPSRLHRSTILRRRRSAAFRYPCTLLAPGATPILRPAFVPWLRQNRARYDAVIVNGLWQYHSFGAWRALRGTATPYYVFPHGMLDPWFKRAFPLKHLKKSLYWPWADYRVLRDASAVLFTCEAEKLLAPSSFALYRAHPVVTGLGTTPPPPDVDTTAFFGRYPDLRGKRLLLFMGRLHPKRGSMCWSSLGRHIAQHPHGALSSLVLTISTGSRPS